ncbi:cation diffusion facilitator family transporter [Kitasatospora sp. NPDC048540]|uniref:cation diffusion facilitator family transporter n=1 Tax=unclassified Kitasatospora TaxID=2633591 RepID=UPI0009ECAAEA|nr:cation diffusion facilitator family transporter [Kitasatospora sp. MBT63]
MTPQPAAGPPEHVPPGHVPDIASRRAVAGDSESTRTVLVATAANLVIAVAKLFTGMLGGSAAMLSEAAHSFADTVTELLLLTALRRSDRPADEEHPFGYGHEAYFWAFLAALATFLAGSLVSVVRGVQEITAGSEPGHYPLSYAVLALAAVCEGVSWRQAARQVRREAARWRVSSLRLLRVTPDTTVKAVALEDSAALVGLVIAAGGLAGSQLTGSPVWDGIASVLIGVLLAVVAVVLTSANKSLLIGQSVPPAMREALRAELLAIPETARVITLFTMVLGPREVLLAARVDFHDEHGSAAVEAACETAERRIRERFPTVGQVFIDPTPPWSDAAGDPAQEEERNGEG